jgi:hypothetical protein
MPLRGKKPPFGERPLRPTNNKKKTGGAK